MLIRLFLVGFFQLFIFSSFSQTSIKFTKPQKAFLYTQLNLHGGGFFDGDKINFNAASKGIRNRVVTQAFFRSGKTLQKGYIRKFGIRSACFAMSLDYDPFFSRTNNSGAVQLRLMDNWIGFGTKKSRRNIWVGNRRLEYGRNPRMDGEANFMNRNSLQVRDFGFWWDLGTVYRSPIIKNPENRWDITLQLSSGGWLFNGAGSQGTLMYMGTSREDSINYLSLSGGDVKYQNTFLAIANIGRPTYSQKEINFFVIVGNIRDQYNLDSTLLVARIGAQHTIKMKESFKFGNQLSIGQNSYASGLTSFAALVNNSLDFSISSKLAVGICQYLGFYKGMNHDQDYFDYSIVSSLAYIASPDIKFRLNIFYDKEEHLGNREHIGAYLQMVVGFGKRL